MKRTLKEMRKAILKSIRDGKEYSYGYIERKANTNWQTVRNHCEDLELFDCVTISKEDKIKITEIGLKVLRKL